MRSPVATGLAITALAVAGLAATGCGDGTTSPTTSTASSTSAQATSVQGIVDQHPDVVTIVCQSTAPSGQPPQIEDRALAAIAPLAMKADVPPGELLSEFRSRC